MFFKQFWLVPKDIKIIWLSWDFQKYITQKHLITKNNNISCFIINKLLHFILLFLNPHKNIYYILIRKYLHYYCIFRILILRSYVHTRTSEHRHIHPMTHIHIFWNLSGFSPYFTIIFTYFTTYLKLCLSFGGLEMKCYSFPGINNHLWFSQ